MICLFHFNDFGGEFGKKISQDLTKLTIVDYSPISGCNIENLSEEVICELSNDVSYNIAKQ